MQFDLVIQNGTIVTAETSYEADVGILGEQIAAIGRGLSGRRVIDARDKLVTPGAVDPHVHLQYPLPGGLRSADDFFSGTRAAAFGGTTTVIDFVEPRPEQAMVDGLADRRALADGQVVIDYGLHMTLGPREIGKLDQVPAAYAAGCASFKLYMAYAMRLNDGELLQALQAVRGVGGLPVVHAENWEVITTLIAQALAAGRTQPRWHPRCRPPELEAEAVSRVIDLATYVGTRVHIFHVSCGAVVERLAAARQRGVPVTGETCPQYLFLDDRLFERPGVEGTLPVCAPPIRKPADQQRLWRALAEDSISLVTTDHCPFTRAEKAAGLDNFSRIPGGVPSIEARFALLYSFGVAHGRFSANRWVDLCCTTPARLFGLARKGHIAVGCDADLVLFDPTRQVTLGTDTLHEQVDWTPYAGLQLTGWPATTICRGAPVVLEGEFVGRAGYGRFVPRAFPLDEAAN